MNFDAIYNSPPGTRILAACPPAARENMIDEVCSAIPFALQSRTVFNTGPVISMDMIPDEEPNRFSDLSALCSKLVHAAGRRSHFEGLLLLSISEFRYSCENISRLKALGELLAMKNGLASECITLLYGPDKERDILFCADHLDFDGRLKVISYEQPDRPSLPELLKNASLRCISPEVSLLLETALNDMSGYKDFNAGRFIRICGDDRGFITEHAVSAMLDDPYSYINRIKKTAQFRSGKTADRKIGFRTER